MIKPKQTISSYLLTLGLISLLMVGSLVAYQVYSALTKTQISKEQEIRIKPLDGNIKLEVIQNLRNRHWFTAQDINKKINKINPSNEIEK